MAPPRKKCTRKNWKLGCVERYDGCAVTFHSDYGRGHYQVKCTGKGWIGSHKSIAKARKQASRGSANLGRRRRR